MQQGAETVVLLLSGSNCLELVKLCISFLSLPNQNYPLNSFECTILQYPVLFGGMITYV